jgi:hypothetical protein
MRTLRYFLLLFFLLSVGSISAAIAHRVARHPPDTIFISAVEGDSLLVLEGHLNDPCHLGYELFDELGRRLLYGIDSTASSGAFRRSYDLRSISKGDFVFFARCAEFRRAFRFHKKTHLYKAREKPAPWGRK